MEFGGAVVIQPIDEPKARAKGSCEHARPRSGTDEGELGEGELYGACTGTLVDDDIESVVLHGGVEVFFYCGVEAVYFVDKEDVSFL